MAEKEPKTLGNRLREWFHLGQEEIVKTSQLGKKLIEGSFAHDELKNTYLEMGAAIYKAWKDGKKTIQIKDLNPYLEKIDKQYDKIKKDEAAINAIKTKNQKRA